MAGGEVLLQRGCDLVEIGLARAAEHIDGQEAMLGPGVQGDMRGRDDGDAGDALWLESMVDDLKDVGVHVLDHQLNGGFERGDVVQSLQAAVVKIQVELKTEHDRLLWTPWEWGAAPPAGGGRFSLLHSDPALGPKIASLPIPCIPER
jgi:hypothetical protein